MNQVSEMMVLASQEATDDKPIVMMTKEEARQAIDQIRATFVDLGQQVEEFVRREGWRALRYANLSECVQAELQDTVVPRLAPIERGRLLLAMAGEPVLVQSGPKGGRPKSAMREAERNAGIPHSTAHRNVAIAQGRPVPAAGASTKPSVGDDDDGDGTTVDDPIAATQKLYAAKVEAPEDGQPDNWSVVEKLMDAFAGVRDLSEDIVAELARQHDRFEELGQMVDYLGRVMEEQPAKAA